METKNDNIAIPDELLRRYSEFCSLGSGAMGAVYRAHDSNLDIDVAIKLLKMRQIAPEIAVRFQQEAKVASKLKHHNLVTLLDFGISEKGEPYIIMESVEGHSLADELQKRGALSIPEAFNIMVQICDGMEHAHRSGIVHRDLKPSNVMVCGDDLHTARIKVLDFGIAKLDDTDGSITRTGTVLGTPYYMSPEQFSISDVDRRTDVYSAGTILFRLLTNHHPFEGESLLEIMEEKQNYEAPLISEIPGAEDIPQEVEEVVARAISKDPDERYATMKEFQDAMLIALEKINIKLEQPPLIEQEKRKLFTREALRTYAKVGAIALMVLLIPTLIISLNVFNKNVEPLGNEQPLRSKAPGKNPLSEGIFSKTYPQDVKGAVWKAKGLIYDRDLEWLAANDASDCHTLILSDTDAQTIQNKITSRGYAVIGKLPLVTLTLVNCAMNDSDLKLVMKNENLKELDISRTGLTDDGIAYLKNSNIEHLLVRGNPITDKCIDTLQTMPKLNHLSLAETGITDKGYEKVGKIKQLKWLNLASTKGTDDGMKYIGQLPSLRELYISGGSHGLSGPHLSVGLRGIEYLSKLKLTYLNAEADKAFDDKCLIAASQYWPNLHNLHIDNTGVTGEGLKVVGKFKQMTTLSLNSNLLHDEDVIHITEMPKLTNLNIIMNAITDKSLERFATMPKLKFVDLTHCKVTTKGLRILKDHEIEYKEVRAEGRDTAQDIMTDLLKNQNDGTF